jgi:ABC-type Fe3+ transport system permease subunit
MYTAIKLFGALLAFGIGLTAKKVVDVVWEKSTGKAPPKSKDGLENSLRAALVFALISGAVSTVIQVLTNRGTQRAINRFSHTRDMV